MGATGRHQSLISALDELDFLADGEDRDKLAGLRGRLEDDRLRVLVVGEAKRGKSTLVNALLGREVLPSGVTPLTAVATTVTYGMDEQAEVAFQGGRTACVPLAELGVFVTERGNPGNRREVAGVTVRLDAPLLARGVELVDTPGTGSVYTHNTQAADSSLPTMDAAVFVLTADPPVSASERDLLTRVAGLSVARFVVLNKADYLDDAGLAEAMEFTARVVTDATGEAARIYPLSARAALTGAGDAGLAKFAADFSGYLETSREADLGRSITAHLLRLTGSLLDQVRLTRRATQMRHGAAAERVDAFAARLDRVRGRERDAEDLVAGETRRMLTELNQSAERESARLAGVLDAEAGRMLAGELGAASPAGIEQEGRARLATLTREIAEAWRQDQRHRLEQGLESLDARLADELNAQLDAVRGAAAELLGLDLTVPRHGQRLAPDLRFFYTMHEDVGQAELLAGAVRHRLPGAAGRRRAGEFLRRAARDLADSQVGRARADLQYRLAEAARQLTGAISGRYAESTGRLLAALGTAAQMREVTAAEAGRRDQELGSRESALAAVAARLSAEGEGGART